MNRSERSILLVTSIGHALCHWCALLVTGIFAPLQSEFNLTGFQVTSLPVIGYVLMGAGALPAGYFTDRFGPKPMLLIYFASTTISCVAAAIAPTTLTFAIALTGLGAAISLYHPTGLAMISHGLEKRGQAMGVHGIAGSIGLCGGPIGMFLANAWHWRLGYWVMAAVALASLFALMALPITLRDDPRNDALPEKSTAPSRQPPVRLLVLLFVPMMLTGINYRAVMTALPTYLAGEGSDSSLITSLQVLVFLAGGASQFLMGRHADRTHPSKFYAKLIALSIPLALLLAWTGGGSYPAIAVALALAVVHFGTQPIENLLIAEHTPRSLRSMSYGLKFTLTFGLGAAAGPLVGYLWDATGTLAWTFVVFAGIALAVAALIMQLVKVVDAEHSASTAENATSQGLGTVNQSG
ncbi:MAG: MFS transporter [Phycisphaerae bacterium]|nr:MAG: MFS transporter [Phycisphaerae bacterium]